MSLFLTSLIDGRRLALAAGCWGWWAPPPLPPLSPARLRRHDDPTVAALGFSAPTTHKKTRRSRSANETVPSVSFTSCYGRRDKKHFWTYFLSVKKINSEVWRDLAFVWAHISSAGQFPRRNPRRPGLRPGCVDLHLSVSGPALQREREGQQVKHTRHTENET